MFREKFVLIDFYEMTTYKIFHKFKFPFEKNDIKL